MDETDDFQDVTKAFKFIDKHILPILMIIIIILAVIIIIQYKRVDRCVDFYENILKSCTCVIQ